jgi:hypothetical protein
MNKIKAGNMTMRDDQTNGQHDNRAIKAQHAIISMRDLFFGIKFIQQCVGMKHLQRQQQEQHMPLDERQQLYHMLDHDDIAVVVVGYQAG